MTSKPFIYLVLSIGILVLAFSLYRDFRYGRTISYDLRNRVVGARLQKDGKDPYFYHWKKEGADSIRYYDYNNFDSLVVSNVTASPFFHDLLYPLADQDQSVIQNWWFALEYVLLALLVGMALRLTDSNRQRLLVAGIVILFLLTDAWIQLLFLGQNYLFIPFLAMLFFYWIRKDLSPSRAVLAGLTAIVLLLVRPNVVFFFIPFLFFWRGWRLRPLVFFLIPVLLLAGWSVLNKNQRMFWQQYQAGMPYHVEEHQSIHPTKITIDPNPNYPYWEGVDVSQRALTDTADPFHVHSENGNVFVLYKFIVHGKLSPKTMVILSLLTMTVFLFMVFLRHGLNVYEPERLVLMGYCLYMIADLFSPVHRHQYYTVQWIFPLLLVAATYRPAFKRPFGVMVIGLLLNIEKLPFLKMQHTMGEYLILGGLSLLVLSSTAWNTTESGPERTVKPI